MIPILYKKDDTDYTRNGAGFLADIISCDVTEERNGEYELTFEYPATGLHYSEISEGDVIKVKANETSDLQLFRIYSHSKPMNGVVTFTAEHISYDANGVPLIGLTSRSSTPQAAINKAIREGAFVSGFTAWSDISALNTIDITKPCSLRAVLGGQEGSILDVWGGEYEFDNYVIKLYAQRGEDRGVTIEYGKNLIDIEQERNITETYTHIMPYAVFTEKTDAGNGDTESTDVIITLAEKVLPLTIAENVGHQKAAIVNLSDMFGENEEITEQALRIKANAYIASHTSLGVPKVNIQASFVSLWQTEEYKDIAPLERVQLCDTVTVRFVKLGISTKAKVIKTVYDTINERYKSVELGEARSSFADTVLKQEKAIADLSSVVRKGFSNATEEMKKAIAEATALITGNAGGYVVLHPAEHPQEILIMDTPDIETAVHVWRWNSAGLGYSSTGYNGTYGLAMTMNGAIVADFITAGTLNGGLLRADSVQANAISTGFKQQIADNISSTQTTIEQEFAAADEQLRSSITTSYTNDISASETRSQTLIQQTANGIMAQVYTKTETGNLIDDAVDDANGYTDTQLGGYYTKSETDSKISVSAQNIMLQVYTKTETDTKVSTAQTAATTAANGYTDTTLQDYYTSTETDTKISASRDAIMLSVYTKTETDTKVSTAQTTATTAAKGYTDTTLQDYYTSIETDTKISASKDAIMLSVYTKTQTDTKVSTAQTAATTAANGYTDTTLQSYSTTTEMNSAISATATSIRTEVNKKVNATDFGTYMQQNYNSFLLGFNNASRTLQLTANGLTVYDGAISDNDKVFALNQSGMQIYLDGDHIGNIGTSDFVGTSDHGVTFQLDTDGYYMMWSRKINSSDTSYTAVLTYTRGSMNGSFEEGEGVYVSAPFYVHDTATLNRLEVKGRTDFDSAVYCDTSITVNTTATINGGMYAKNGITVSGGTSSFSENVSITSSATLTVSGETTLNGQLNMNRDIVMGSSRKIKIANDYGIYCGDLSVLKWRNSGNVGVVAGNSTVKLYLTGNEVHAANRLFLDSPREIVFIGSDGYYHNLVKYNSGTYFGNDYGTTYINGNGGIHAQTTFYMEDGCEINIANGSGITMRGNRVLGWANSRVDFGINNDTSMTIHTSQMRIDSRYLVLNGMRGTCQIGFARSGTTDMTGDMNWSYIIEYDPSSNIATFYGDVGSSSDARKKKDVSDLNERYLKFIKTVKPVSFKYTERINDRFHNGFIAQDVLKALEESGLTPDDFAGFKDINGDGSEYALMYNEFIAPLLLYIKHLEGRIENLERVI